MNTTARMTELERLIAIEDIKMLMGRRCRALDAKDWDTYEACHSPDHVSIDTTRQGEQRGASLIEGLKKYLEGITSIHQVHTPEIQFESSTQARGVWSLEDWLFWKDNGQREWFHGWANYHDTYAKLDGGWVFTSRRLERLRFECSPGAKRRL